MAEPVQTPQAFAPRIFSGIQPSGGLTLGNYLGALKRSVEKQDEGIEARPREPAPANPRGAAAFIAAGIDPQRSILFNQSQVTAHAELAWIFNCVARMGWMGRMTQWKDKAGKNSENASLGLFAYPALMAADILAYKATHVPVGEDQKQHLELTRDIAAKFNNDFKVDFFPITEPVIEGAGARVMSLRDGSKKMSKSDPSDQSRINLTDSPDAIAKKIRKSKTDPEPLPSEVDGLKDRPEARNLVNIYAGLSGLSPAQVLAEHGGAQFGTFKPALADLAVSVMGPITSEMNRLMQDTAEIDRILGDGAARADAIAGPVLDDVYDIVGMIRSRR